MQLSIPVILGRAVDQTQAVAAAKADPATLYPIALLLFIASVARGVFTLVQNYTAEAVGHALARDIRNAGELFEFESKIDQLCLIAFDIYMQCREKVYLIRANETRNRTFKAFERAGLISEKAE